MEDLLDYTQQKSNRQLSITVDHWHQQVLMRNEKIKLLERDIVMMQKHHLEEVMEVIEHAREKAVKETADKILKLDRRLYSQKIGPLFGNKFALFLRDLLFFVQPSQDNPLILIPFSLQNRSPQWPYKF